MDVGDFRESLRRAIPRHAKERVRRKIWTRERALGTSRGEFAQLFPRGSATPYRHLCRVVDEASGACVGETWYTAEEKGGKVQFWVDWIWIDPRLRRIGFATEVLRLLEATALRKGTERIGLTVWTEIPGALAPYSKLGYSTFAQRMMKALDRRSPVRSRHPRRAGR